MHGTFAPIQDMFFFCHLKAFHGKNKILAKGPLLSLDINPYKSVCVDFGIGVLPDDDGRFPFFDDGRARDSRAWKQALPAVNRKWDKLFFYD